MNIIKITRTLFNTFRLHGAAEMIRVGWLGLLYNKKKRLILFALSHPKPLPEALIAAKDHSFRFASTEELLNYQKHPEYQITDLDIKRSKNGGKCLLQMDGDVLTGFTWIWQNKLPHIEDGIHLNLPDDTIYNYKAYTAPAYRGYGFQGLRHLELLRILKPEGITRLFGYVDHLNSRSLSGVKKSGYVPVGELIIFHKKNGKVNVKLEVKEHFWSRKHRLYI